MDFEFPFFRTTDPNEYSPLTLAYIGDAVYEIYIRSYVTDGKNMPVSKLHRASTHYVSARAQSKAAHAMTNFLTDEENAVFKRGRNAHSNTSAKNADIVDYRHATGFEALLGYLFIRGDYARLFEIMSFAVECIGGLHE